MKKKIIAEIDRRINTAKGYYHLSLNSALHGNPDRWEQTYIDLISLRKFITKLK